MRHEAGRHGAEEDARPGHRNCHPKPARRESKRTKNGGERQEKAEKGGGKNTDKRSCAAQRPLLPTATKAQHTIMGAGTLPSLHHGPIRRKGNHRSNAPPQRAHRTARSNQAEAETPRRHKPHRSPTRRAPPPFARSNGMARIMTKSARRQMAEREGTFGGTKGDVSLANTLRFGMRNVTYWQAIDFQLVARNDERVAQGVGRRAEGAVGAGAKRRKAAWGAGETGGKKLPKDGRAAARASGMRTCRQGRGKASGGAHGVARRERGAVFSLFIWLCREKIVNLPHNI